MKLEKWCFYAPLTQVRVAFLPVPLQPSVIVPVKEVRLCSSSSHVRMDSYKLQDRSRASFFHANYDGVWQLFIAKL